jgi:hypothetical protein
MGAMKCETYTDAKNNDVTVGLIIESGGSIEDVVVALVNEKERMFQRILELELIAPKKISSPDGRVLVWHCPDDLIPTETI